MEHIQEMAQAYKLASESLVNHRAIFMPSDQDCAPAPFHYRWSDLLLHGTKHIAIEGYRESAKTQYIIRGHTLYRLQYPSKDYDYIIFIKSTQEIADAMLKEIANRYINDPGMSANLVKVNKNIDGVFDCIVRDLSGDEINVRIESYGKGSSAIRGLVWGDIRPKLCLIDDCQSLEDAQSETVLKKDWTWFLSDVTFLGKSTRIFMIGNNLGEKCIIEQVIASAKDLGFDVERVPVMDEHGNPTWPSRNTKEEIEAEKESFRNLGQLEVWLREKMCQAIDPETQLFKKEYLKYVEAEPKGLSKYVLVDPAISKEDKSCFTAIMTWGVNSDNHRFLVDIDYGHFDPGQTIEGIFRAVSKHRPFIVGIEDVGYQKALQWLLNQEMPKRNIFFRVEPLKHQGKAKEIRIQSLQPRYKAGTVWHLAGLHGLAEYESELLTFKPGVKSRVDLIDASAYQDQIMVAPTVDKSKHKEIPRAGRMV
jgi:hypothetical protein